MTQTKIIPFRHMFHPLHKMVNTPVQFEDALFRRAPSPMDFVVHEVPSPKPRPWPKQFYQFQPTSYHGTPAYAAIILLANGYGLQCLTNDLPQQELVLDRGADHYKIQSSSVVAADRFAHARFHLTGIEVMERKSCGRRHLTLQSYMAMDYSQTAHDVVMDVLASPLRKGIKDSTAADDILLALYDLPAADKMAEGFDARQIKAPQPTCYAPHAHSHLIAY